MCVMRMRRARARTYCPRTGGPGPVEYVTEIGVEARTEASPGGDSEITNPRGSMVLGAGRQRACLNPKALITMSAWSLVRPTTSGTLWTLGNGGRWATHREAVRSPSTTRIAEAAASLILVLERLSRPLGSGSGKGMTQGE